MLAASNFSGNVEKNPAYFFPYFGRALSVVSRLYPLHKAEPLRRCVILNLESGVVGRAAGLHPAALVSWMCKDL